MGLRASSWVVTLVNDGASVAKGEEDRVKARDQTSERGIERGWDEREY